MHILPAAPFSTTDQMSPNRAAVPRALTAANVDLVADRTGEACAEFFALLQNTAPTTSPAADLTQAINDILLPKGLSALDTIDLTDLCAIVGLTTAYRPQHHSP